MNLSILIEDLEFLSHMNMKRHDGYLFGQLSLIPII